MKQRDRSQRAAPAASESAPTADYRQTSDALAYAVAALSAAYTQAPDRARLLPRLTAAIARIAALGDLTAGDDRLERLRVMQGEAARLAAEHLEHKKRLAASAASLAQSTDWKRTRSTLDGLTDEWRDTGWSDDAQTAEPRKQFNDAVAMFTCRQERWFDEQRMHGAPVPEYREYLCTRAEQLTCETDDTMWPASTERLRQLVALWKKAAQVPEDPALSARFAGAERAFREKKEQWYAANREERERLIRRIEDLTETAAGLAWEEARREATDVEEHEWRDAGQLPRDESETMERRFRAAMAAFRIRQAEAEQQALKRKQTVVARIEALGRNPLCNWKATRATLLELQQAYVDAGPVAVSREPDLLQSYRAACQSVVSRMGTLKGNSTEKRQEITRQIRDLTQQAGSGITWRDARTKVLALQKQYTGAGPIGRAEGEVLWQEYRVACDRFFELYRRWTEDNVDQKEVLCAAAEALLSERDPFDAKEKAKKLQQRWKSSGPVPPEKGDDLWSRFCAAIDRVFERARVEWEDLHRP